MSHSDLDDIHLYHRLKEDDPEAFKEIYDRYWHLLYTTSRNILHDDDSAKDTVQEVFISLWQRRAVVHIEVLKGYLQQAVRFQALKSIRAHKTDEEFYKRLADVTAEIVYDNPLVFKEQEASIRKIIDDLPEDCRLVFKLSRDDHFTYKQIASRLSISEKTVEKRMTICLKHIRRELADKQILSMILFVTMCVRH